MADTQEGVGLTTKWFGLNLTGQSAGVTFIFIIILALIGLTLYENGQRNAEHDQIQCALKLTLYMQQQPQGQTIDWHKMPIDLYTCIPSFLYRTTTER
jgi:hypothetical protein